LVTLATVAISLVVALVVPNVEFVFGLLGATASVILAYILPALICLRLSGVRLQALGARTNSA
jgi:sodium-coupled neutral amino acid transporter 10